MPDKTTYITAVNRNQFESEVNIVFKIIMGLTIIQHVIISIVVEGNRKKNKLRQVKGEET